MNTPTFESSDSVRSAKPLAHAKSVTLDSPLKLELGGYLAEVKVAYESYGKLNAAKNNAILICHAISGDSHVAQHDESDDPGWWEILVGPGKPVDTNKFFVICPNLLGGCRGTTGPGCINPETGKPYGRDFPQITIGDMVEVQRRLLDHLGIEQLHAVVGGSIGGHQAMTWATRFPKRLRGTVAMATSPRLTSQALAFDIVGRNAILRDPHFHNGQYYDKTDGPAVGLAIARMIGHITYLSREAMTEKFDADRMIPRDVQIEFENAFSVGSYLGHQGAKFVERFDANSYMTLSMAMDRFSLGATPSELAATLRTASCDWLVLSFSSDWLFPPDQSRDIVNALIANNARVSYSNIESKCGHDAFLLPDEFKSYGEMVRAFLDNLPGLSGKAEASPATEQQEEPRQNSIFQQRVDYGRIVELIPANASVLDLGCGSGRLLSLLRQDSRRRLKGVELDEFSVLKCLNHGLHVVQADLNNGLRAFGDQQFDYVVLSQTLQAVQDVEGIIADMLRVGRVCIVSFPNLGYEPLRRILAEEGRAPRAYGWLRDKWYNTNDIRHLSIIDFEEFCAEKGVHILRRIGLNSEKRVEVIDDPNRNADVAIFVISRDGAAKASA